MNFLSAMLLSHVRKEEDAFWCLSLLVEQLLEGYFDTDMVQSRVDLLVFKGLLAERLPDINAHFALYEFDVSMITARWFICMFVDCLPEPAAVEVWCQYERVIITIYGHITLDSAPLEVWCRLFQQTGRHILHQVALAVLQTHQELILRQADFTGLIQCLQSSAEAITDESALMQLADEQQEGIEARCAALNEKYKAVVLQEICREERRQHLKKHPTAKEAELEDYFGPIVELPGEKAAREASELEAAESLVAEAAHALQGAEPGGV